MLDINADGTGQQYYRLTQLCPEPEFVKEASDRISIAGFPNMSPHLYADPQQRKYATHTPAATWVSALYFYGDRSGSPATRELVNANLEKMAKYHGIADLVTGLRAKFDADTVVLDTDLPDSDFALIRKEGEVKSRHMRLLNAKEVKVAAAWFTEYRDEFAFAERVKIAEALLEKANRYGADLGEQLDGLEKQACLGVSANADIVDLIRSRIHALGPIERPTPLQTDLLKLAQTYKNDPRLAGNQACVRTLAETIDAVDRANGLHYRYDSFLRRPEDVLFGVTTKLAAQLEQSLVPTVTGNYYRLEDLQCLDAGTLQGIFGDAFTAHAAGGAFIDGEKLAAWIPQMSAADAGILDGLLKTSGVIPAMTTQVVTKPMITPEDEEKLAAHYAAGRAIRAGVV